MAVSLETFLNHGVEIRNGSMGRSLFTTRDFKKDEKLLEEKPLVSCQFSWNAAYGYLACDFCMSPLETAEENLRRLAAKPQLILPHSECDKTNKDLHVICPYCAIPYCSPNCRDQAWNQYHQTTCHHVLGGNPNHPLEKLNEAWKVMHYPPETASIQLLVRILASMIQSKERDELKSEYLRLCHHAVNDEDTIAHKLLGKEFENQLEQLRDLTIKALDTSQINEFLTPEGFRSLFALMGRNGQGIGTSSFSVWVENATDSHDDDQTNKFIDSVYVDMENESGDFLNNEGSGLFTIQSSANHSCSPNSQPTFPYADFTLVLVATRDLKANEQVFISYLDDCALSRSRHSRRKFLKENYLFLCECERCQQEIDQPDLTSEDEESMDED